MARGRPQAHRLGMGLQVGQASLGLQGLRLTLTTMPDFLHHFQPEPEPPRNFMVPDASSGTYDRRPGSWIRAAARTRSSLDATLQATLPGEENFWKS